MESAGGILLLVSAVVALVWANTPWRQSYFAIGEVVLGLRFEGVVLEKTLVHWINDGLMAWFFLLVGLEIKREVQSGELKSLGQSALPIAAAIGGMAVPAGLYALVNLGGAGMRGFGIPMATDIAFALGALSFLGSWIPQALRIFLSALAIADDLGAILVIAIFYSGDLSNGALLGAAGCLALLIGMNALGLRKLPGYLLVGVVLWLCVLKSGIHATIAGVLLAFTIPGRPDTSDAEPPLERLEHALHPLVTFAILPLFAFVNAGVAIEGEFLRVLASPITLGVVAGLVLGKPLGIFASSYLVVRLGWARLPAGCNWNQILGVGCLAGIGFTMSLFVAELAFHSGPALGAAKLGILIASAAAGALGMLVLRR